MLTREQVEAFWTSRTDQLNNCKDPCHYMNKWMDKYTFETRTAALKQLNCFRYGTALLVDIGCGVGKYTQWMHKNLCPFETIGFDRAEFIEQTQDDYLSGLDFRTGLVPDPQIAEKIKEADTVTLLTVYDFMSIEDRATLRSYLSEMRQESHVVMIDLFMDKLPWHQNELSYKHVETWNNKVHEMMEIGFVEEQQVPVSKANMRVFHKLGKNPLSYALSHLVDYLPLITPQLMAVSFRKV